MEVRSRGFAISYEVTGAGRPLVLIPGLFQSVERWRVAGYMDHFSSKFRLIVIDPLGHGKSEKPHDAAAYEMPDCASDVLAVMDAERVESAPVWGYSRGGIIACTLASTAPSRVSALIVGGSRVAAPTGEAAAAWTNAVQRLGQFIAEGDADSALRLLGVGDAAIRQELAATNDLVALACVMAGAELGPAVYQLGRITRPPLVYAGELEPALAAMTASAALWGAEFHVITGQTHSGTFLRSDLVIPLVEEYLETA